MICTSWFVFHSLKLGVYHDCLREKVRARRKKILMIFLEIIKALFSIIKCENEIIKK